MVLISRNPHWGIELVGPDQQPITWPQEPHGLRVVDPILPFWCSVKLKMISLFFSLAVVAAGFLVVYGGQRSVMWYMRHKECKSQEVYQLVEKIIETLVSHHNAVQQKGSGEAYLAINHVRDQLIPPPERIRKATLWDQAVKFLDDNESRVRSEVQRIAGEEYHVWRWLPIASPTHPRRKVWQGQAFETMEGSVNSVPCSLTPCLKIRHMFDPEIEYGENWPVRIQDAILEKCEGVQILHVVVDRSSNEGCVYVKCNSQDDAGRAYRALHGWWFDGNLVTVKYLRLERYHERFPDSVKATALLQPSNNQRLSLQDHSWKSPLERI